MCKLPMMFLGEKKLSGDRLVGYRFGVPLVHFQLRSHWVWLGSPEVYFSFFSKNSSTWKDLKLSCCKAWFKAPNYHLKNTFKEKSILPILKSNSNLKHLGWKFYYKTIVKQSGHILHCLWEMPHWGAPESVPAQPTHARSLRNRGKPQSSPSDVIRPQNFPSLSLQFCTNHMYLLSYTWSTMFPLK